RIARDHVGRWAVALGTVLALGTAIFIDVPSLQFAIRAPQLDIALTTIGAVVSTGVAALSIARYREEGGVERLLEGSAFFVLAPANLANGVVIITGVDGGLGMSVDAPGQLPLYYWALARLVSAALLASAALPSIARLFQQFVRPDLVVWLPSFLFVTACGALWLERNAVPRLSDPTTLRRLAEAASSGAPLPAINLAILMLDGA